MRKSSLYRSLCLYILGALVVILPSGLSAFDTYWHSQISTQVGRQYGFSADAVKTMQFASFAVDYFWVFLADVESTIEKGLSYLEFKNTPLTIAERLGLTPEELIADIRLLDRPALARLFDQHEQIWHW